MMRTAYLEPRSDGVQGVDAQNVAIGDEYVSAKKTRSTEATDAPKTLGTVELDLACQNCGRIGTKKFDSKW